MIDKEQAELLKESGEVMRKLDKEEEKAKDEVVKYFDRIHDKLFAYQLFFLAGYISLIAIPSICVSVWWLVIPVFCVIRLIYIDWRMMEQNRFRLDLSNKSLREIKVHNDSKITSNDWRFMFICSSLCTLISRKLLLLKSNRNLFCSIIRQSM